ncbi:hypothetical protein Krac_7262 [Ktedonobacter racemifer DSM 44963]|uniref:Uncharacterized protein n=2 Tax=Ktedonobacter racemifer TaxID=363277 RepID=D6TRP4_KTERA|nr:hypothetical protein Krac_7262 [Ktedonobacter racemifer DSM 44963]
MENGFAVFHPHPLTSSAAGARALVRKSITFILTRIGKPCYPVLLLLTGGCGLHMMLYRLVVANVVCLNSPGRDEARNFIGRVALAEVQYETRGYSFAPVHDGNDAGMYQ